MRAHQRQGLQEGAERITSMRKYIREEGKNKGFLVALAIVLMMLVIWYALEVCGVFDMPVWKPGEAIPIANANISWEQTFYPGSW